MLKCQLCQPLFLLFCYLRLPTTISDNKCSQLSFSTMFSKCRACLGFSDNMKLLTQDAPEGKQLISKFTSINNFEWISNERIASYLCDKCESALEISYTFQRQCQETHDIITKQLESPEMKLTERCDETDLDRDEDSPDECTKDKLTVRRKKPRMQVFSLDEVEQAIHQYKHRQKQGHFKCIVCQYVLATLKALSSHMSQLHKDVRNSWCYICNQTYQNLAEHRQSHKSLVELCPFCNKKIRKRYFIEHLRLHCNVRPYVCRFCDRGFLSNSSLVFHTKLRHRDKAKGNTGRQKNSWNNNSMVQIEKEDGCDINSVATHRHNFCSKCDKKVRSLSAHINKVHLKNKKEDIPQTYMCYICTKELKSSIGLKAHLRLHDGDTPHKCSYCGRPHKSRAQLIDHERTHTGEKPFICNVCGKGFAQSGALGTHMKLHTGRPVVCQLCEKRFCRPSELKLHMRTHSGDKPFLCTECGKAFIQKSHLTEHMKTHSDIRPFKCAYCDKGFKQKSLLTSHLQIHSGYKPYQCTFCAYACLKPYRLQQHMKQHNNETKKDKMCVCPVCQKGFSSQTMLNSHVTSSHNAIL